MKNYYFFFCSLLFILPSNLSAQTAQGSRMKEIFLVQELSTGGAGGTRYKDPWEVTYGPDDSLWITEAKNYKLYKVSPGGGARRMILDISQGSTFLPLADRPFNLQFNFSGQGNPQGGFAGLAVHPNFLTGSPYVYVSYIWKYDSTSVTSGGGVFFKNSLVRFTYNFTSGLLGNPVAVCDTIPGSSDHNSQRIIIAPVNGVKYLFYAAGDMGAGQFGNSKRINKAQNSSAYQGKILRFNLDSAGLGTWIPADNPSATSGIWSLGIRNNQGFAYAKINGIEYLYGQSHGPFSDDEVNIIKKSGNYGHPLVIGYAADGNYDGSAAGESTLYSGSLPVIGSEVTNAAGLANYQDPIYTFFPSPLGTLPANTSGLTTIRRINWDFNHGTQGNAAWLSEAPSGLDIYTKSMIPGWKNSLLSAALKGVPGGGGGKIIRLKLSNNGDTIMKTANRYVDTTGYFISQNRFRDLAVSPNGLSFFTVIDSSSTTSGPSSSNPGNSLCKGCLLKYTFLGYADNGTTSTLPDTINIASGPTNVCINANTVTINSANNNTNVWVPITDTNSNIIAEIYANGNNLGAVTTSYYLNSGTVRETVTNNSLYSDRNITITPATQPSTSVKIRLYLTNTEYTSLKTAMNSMSVPSGIVTINDVGIFKNQDPCNSYLNSNAALFTTTPFTRSTALGQNGYALQVSIPSFSSFYFANKATTLLPLNLISFTGSLVNYSCQLQWITENENGTKQYILEQSINGSNFVPVTTVAANNTQSKSTYNYTDATVNKLVSTIVYYRLKIVDATGKYSYSDIVIISLPGITSSVIVRPNPVLNEATIDINVPVTENVQWQLTDNYGRTIMQKGILLIKGANTFKINVSHLPRGIYYLKVKGDTINQNVKFDKL